MLIWLKPSRWTLRQCHVVCGTHLTLDTIIHASKVVVLLMLVVLVLLLFVGLVRCVLLHILVLFVLFLFVLHVCVVTYARHAHMMYQFRKMMILQLQFSTRPGGPLNLDNASNLTLASTDYTSCLDMAFSHMLCSS